MSMFHYKFLETVIFVVKRFFFHLIFVVNLSYDFFSISIKFGKERKWKKSCWSKTYGVDFPSILDDGIIINFRFNKC